MELKDFVSGLLSEAKKERESRKASRTRSGQRKKSTNVSTEVVPVPEVIDPWHKTSIILLTTHTTCKCCGEIMISCEPHLFLEMFKGSRAKGTFVRRIERITNYSGKWAELYATLPKRTEPRLTEVDTCPFCFGFEATNAGLHYDSPLPIQQEFNFNEELSQDSH
jgi:hypothetical protein